MKICFLSDYPVLYIIIFLNFAFYILYESGKKVVIFVPLSPFRAYDSETRASLCKENSDTRRSYKFRLRNTAACWRYLIINLVIIIMENGDRVFDASRHGTVYVYFSISWFIFLCIVYGVMFSCKCTHSWRKKKWYFGFSCTFSFGLICLS